MEGKRGGKEIRGREIEVEGKKGESVCVLGEMEGRRLHMKVIFETNIFFFTARSVYLLAKSNVWVHFATVDSLDPGQWEDRECESVTQNRPSEKIFLWRHGGNREK